MPERARAPYNFVPLVDGEMLPGELVSHDRYHQDRRTGYFDVNLETITPLFIRGMISEEQKSQGIEAKDLPFPLTINGLPVIPGSSLRGMIRNVIEIITFGKIHFVSDARKIFFRTVAASGDDPYRRILGEPNLEVHAGRKVRAGYLVYRDQSWYVQPAQSFGSDHPFALVPDREDVVNGVDGIKHLTDGDYRIACFDVCYRMGSNNKVASVFTPPPSRTADATLVCTGNMAETQGSGQQVRTKRKYFVLLKKATDNRFLPIHSDIVEAYLGGLSPFQKGETEQSNGYLSDQMSVLQPGKPVFFVEEDGEVIHFGHTPNFRVAHLIVDSDGKKRAVTPRDRVPAQLLDPHFIDYADAMFGYVSSQGGKAKRNPVAYAGRISVTSATPDEGQSDLLYGDDYELLRTPGSPKPTTFQHYLEQPQGTATPRSDLNHYGKAGAKLRGDKLYWRQHVDIEQLQRGNTDGTKPDIETRFRPVREGKHFSFRVYFENLSDAELGALAWALNLDKDLYHMLGMGKPYGLGVIKLKATLFLTNRNERYKSLFSKDGHWYEAKTMQPIDDFVSAFKRALASYDIDFEMSDRIKELKAMLGLYRYDPEFFSYMRIGVNENEYRDRLVLPRPSEVISSYREKERERRRQEKARIGFEVGDEIAGNVIESTSEGIWFSLKKQYEGKQYEGFIPKDKVLRPRGPNARIDARVFHIDDSVDPGILRCEQIAKP